MTFTRTIRAAFCYLVLMLSGASLSGAEDLALKEAFDRLPAAEKHYRAGLMEFRTGNNFGFVAFCGYPAAAARRTRPPARTPCAPARLRGRAPS